MQSGLQVVDTIVFRQLAHTHRQATLQAVDAHERARREVLMLHVRCRRDELAAFHRASDHAPWAHSRLVIVCLRRRAGEGAAVRTVDDRGVEGELRPTLPRRPRQDLAHPELLHARRARRRLHRRPRRLSSGAELEVLLDAALTEDVPAAIDRCRPSRQALADCALHVVGNATFHPLLFEALLEGHRIDFDGGQALWESRRRDAVCCACAAARRARRRRRCTLRIGVNHHQWNCAAAA